MKESDRLTAVAETLNALGAQAEEGPDFLKITGRESLEGGSRWTAAATTGLP